MALRKDGLILEQGTYTSLKISGDYFQSLTWTLELSLCFFYGIGGILFVRRSSRKVVKQASSDHFEGSNGVSGQIPNLWCLLILQPS